MTARRSSPPPSRCRSMAASRSSAHRAFRRWAAASIWSTSASPHSPTATRCSPSAWRSEPCRTTSSTTSPTARRRCSSTTSSGCRSSRWHAGGGRNRDARGRGSRPKCQAGGVASATVTSTASCRRSVDREPRRFAALTATFEVPQPAGPSRLPALLGGGELVEIDVSEGAVGGGQRRAPGAAPLSLRLTDRRLPAFALTPSRQRRARRVHRARLHPRRARRRRRAQRRRCRPRRLRSGGVHAAVAAATRSQRPAVLVRVPCRRLPELPVRRRTCGSHRTASTTRRAWLHRQHGGELERLGLPALQHAAGDDGGYEYGEARRASSATMRRRAAGAAARRRRCRPAERAEYWANPVLLHLNISSLSAPRRSGALRLPAPAAIPTAPASRRSRAGSASISSRRSHRRSRCRSTRTTCSHFDEPVRLPSHLGGATSPPPPSPSPTTCHFVYRRAAGRPAGSGRHEAGAPGAGVCSMRGWGLGEEEGVHPGQWANSATGSSQYDEGASATGPPARRAATRTRSSAAQP